MIFLFIFALSVSASEPEDRSSQLYQSFCINCHGESLDKIPLKHETTTEERIRIVKSGAKGMPPYAWLPKEGDAERIVAYLEEKTQVFDALK